LYEAVLFHYCKLELIVAALWAVEHLLKSAGMVPAEDHPVFARLLNAQGIHDKESLLKSLTENPRLLSTIGMSFDQQSCLMRHLAARGSNQRLKTRLQQSLLLNKSAFFDISA
jgi:hypothetical protein